MDQSQWASFELKWLLAPDPHFDHKGESMFSKFGRMVVVKTRGQGIQSGGFADLVAAEQRVGRSVQLGEETRVGT